jgi:hypothetical protein
MYYDFQLGWIFPADNRAWPRDMIHNHTVQLVALTAMEPPVSLDAEAVRNEKVKVLKAIQPLNLGPGGDVARAQYASGMMGGKASGDTLAELYASESDVTIKKTIIQALGMQDNDAALVAMARKEKDPVLKRDIVNRLSHSRSKVATDYMLELLSDK